MRWFVALLSGTLFGAGLALSGMMDPARVRGFLDILGAWDPTLAFVMGGAVIVVEGAWAIQRRMAGPALDTTFQLPGTKKLDARLIGGSALFGAGWGRAGLCPGPGIASLTPSPLPAATFVFAMIAGMALYAALPSNRKD